MSANLPEIPDKFDIPQDVYDSPKKLGEYIAALRERKAHIKKVDDAIRKTLAEAEDAMLESLNASGQTHYAFDGLGRFAKSRTKYISFPKEEDGGRQGAIDWLKQCLDAGLLDIDEMLSIQQARVSKEPVLALEAAVNEYNQKHTDKLPESPFNKYEKVSLSFTTKV